MKALAIGAAALILACCGARGVPKGELERYLRAQKAYSAGRYAEAAELADTRRAFAPSLVLRGKALYFLGEPAGAERALLRAAKARPSSTEAGLYLAHALRADGRGEAAALRVETLLADDPADIRALRLAAELAADRGESSIAAAYLDRAAEASMEAGLVFLSRARLRWIAADALGALADLEAAETLFPPDSQSRKAAAELAARIREGGR